MRKRKTPTERLAAIADIIETVDNRAMAVDGPVTPTLQEMTQPEMTRIYLLAIGKPENYKLGARR